MKFNPVTPIAFYVKASIYVSGDGAEASWLPLPVLFCEWRTAFGERASAAQALGVNESATVRTFYHPDIYSALREKRTVIVKNADVNALALGAPDKNNPNVFELWGGVDNVAEGNMYMEFKVRRYEGK